MNVNKLVLISVLILTNPFNLKSQTLKLESSSDQSWSGGIAGRSGNNYTFVINCSNLKQEIVPDTLWIGDEAIPLFAGDSVNRGNVKITWSKNKTIARLEITAATEKDEYNMANRWPDKVKTAPVRPPFSFKGVALLGYHFGGIPRYFTISRFTKIFPPIDYP